MAAEQQQIPPWMLGIDLSPQALAHSQDASGFNPGGTIREAVASIGTNDLVRSTEDAWGRIADRLLAMGSPFDQRSQIEPAE